MSKHASGTRTYWYMFRSAGFQEKRKHGRIVTEPPGSDGRQGDCGHAFAAVRKKITIDRSCQLCYGEKHKARATVSLGLYFGKVSVDHLCTFAVWSFGLYAMKNAARDAARVIKNKEKDMACFESKCDVLLALASLLPTCSALITPRPAPSGKAETNPRHFRPGIRKTRRSITQNKNGGSGLLLILSW